MFSLIITIIAIALVGVLAIATIWYGTDIYQEQLTEAGAAQIINEAEQIENAILAFNVEQGRPPVIDECDPIADSSCEPLQELIDYDYLSSTPSTGTSGGTWLLSDITGATKALVKTVDFDECARSNDMMGFSFTRASNEGYSLTPAVVPNSTPAEDSDLVPVCDDSMPSYVVCCEPTA